MANDTSANIYESMLTSPAFTDLTKNQRFLYVCMKKQYYGKRKPGRDFPDVERFQGDELFYFNRSLAVDKYKLYKDGGRSEFYADIKALERHGFIETVSSGKETKSRSIYRFSGDWKTWSK